MLRALRRPLGGPPRQATAAQVYLTANTERIGEIYRERAPTSNKRGIALRLAIAKELYDEEPEAVQKEYKRRGEEAHKQEVAKHDAAKSGEPSAEPAVQAE